ncbi:hypothetical protein [Actinokineospora sp. NPDC004072]
MAHRLLIPLLLLAACASPPPQQQAWQRIDAGPQTGVDGWDGGFLAAGTSLMFSANARDWRPTSPPRLRARVDTAAHGPAAYLLGWTATALIVWRTEDGEHWQPSVLLDRVPEAKPELVLAAGARGVLVVASDPERLGLTYWHAPDGRAFGRQRTLPGAEEVTAHSFPTAAATPDGFLVDPGWGLGSATNPVGHRILPPRIYASPDGRTWADIGPGLPEGMVEGMAGNRGTVVVVTTPFAGDSGQQFWFRRDGVWRQAGIDPGRLGDPAVVADSLRVLDDLRDWGPGFLAVGHAADSGASYVWTSATGSGWTRLPEVGGVADVAVAGGRTLLTGKVDAWLSHAEPAFDPDPPDPHEPPTSTTTGPARHATDLPVFDPWTEPVAPAEGTADCEFESAVTDRGDAWECSAGGKTYDPCFLHPGGGLVACWTGRATTVFAVPEPLRYEDVESALTWRMDLATGDVCTVHTGELIRNGVEPLWMVCQPGKGARYVWSWVTEDSIQTSMTVDGELTTTEVVAQYR